MRYSYDALAVLPHNRENELQFDFFQIILTISKKQDAATTLWWLVLFPVKFAYLLFFRRLISCVHYLLNIWWWFVVIFTVPAGCTCLAASWLTCPHLTEEGVLCE